jgi:hypothetical protein
MKRKIWSVVLLILFLSSSTQVISGYVIQKAPEGGADEVGTVQVQGNPGVQIKIDNTMKGIIPESGVLIIQNVREGSRQLQAVKVGHPIETYPIEVFINQTAIVEISPESRYGDLMVTSTPPGIKVYLDMHYKGITPCNLTNLFVGGYKLSLQLEGYQDWEQDIMIKPGEKKTISAVLIPNEHSTSTTSSKTPGFSSSLAGIALICVGLWYKVKKRKT